MSCPASDCINLVKAWRSEANDYSHKMDESTRDTLNEVADELASVLAEYLA